MTGITFGTKPENKETENKSEQNSKALINIFERQKEYDSSLDRLNEKIELIEHNDLNNNKKIFSELKEIKEVQKELKAQLETIREFNAKVSKQMKLIATKDELAKLEKYLDFWEPIKFITREEMEKNNKEIVQKLKEIIIKLIE